MSGGTAYITGAASGIARAVAEMLVKKDLKVFLTDLDADGVKAVADALNESAGSQVAFSAPIDTADWNSQAKAFGQAVTQLGRIDYVYPIAGIGERRWLPKTDPQLTQSGYERPDLTTLDIDLTGMMFTVAIAVQQFRRQDVDKNGFRGRIACVASVCGYYCASTLPIYTAAKHGAVGFVRSYGKYLPQEKIAFNAVCPNVVRTNISVPEFYNKLEAEGLMTPLQGVIDTFESLYDGEHKGVSGECFEVGPNCGKMGEKAVKRPPPEYLDPESSKIFEMLDKRGLPLQTPQ